MKYTYHLIDNMGVSTIESEMILFIGSTFKWCNYLYLVNNIAGNDIYCERLNLI